MKRILDEGYEAVEELANTNHVIQRFKVLDCVTERAPRLDEVHVVVFEIRILAAYNPLCLSVGRLGKSLENFQSLNLCLKIMKIYWRFLIKSNKH